MILYHFPTSPFARRVRRALQHKGLSAELRDVRAKFWIARFPFPPLWPEGAAGAEAFELMALADSVITPLADLGTRYHGCMTTRASPRCASNSSASSLRSAFGFGAPNAAAMATKSVWHARALARHGENASLIDERIKPRQTRDNMGSRMVLGHRPAGGRIRRDAALWIVRFDANRFGGF